MSDFLKKMKSIFVEAVDDGSQPVNAETNSEVKAETNNTDTSKAYSENSTNHTSSNTEGQQSDQFYKVLFGALEANNQPGFDYLEFKKALMGLDNLGMDEKTKYLSAFAGAKASGATAQGLMDSAVKYLDVLLDESNKFKNAVEIQKSKQISNRENELGQLNNLISGKTEQINKLQAEIEEHKNMLKSLESEISNAREKIEITIADFNVTYDGLVMKIKNDVDRIKTYINN